MAAFNEVIHQPTRLQIMAALNALEEDAELEFTALRDLLGVTDGNLATHLRKLVEAGYVRERKAFVLRRPRTYLALTPAGRQAFAGHVEALRQLLNLAPNASGES